MIQKKILERIQAFKQWPKAMKTLAMAVFCLNIALALKDTAFTNFANDLGFNAKQLGLIESVREVPGLLTVVMAMVTYFITESMLASICLFIVGAGMIVFSISGTFAWLLVASFVYSIGFHLFFPLQDSMSMKMGKPEESGRLLGLFGSIGSAAALCGMIAVIILSKVAPTHVIFAIAAVFGFIGGYILIKNQRAKSKLKPRTLIFRWRYRYYYILTFLSGCRRHIFTVFAPYVLVKVFHMDLTSMAILMTINQLLNIYLKQRIGRMIDTLGERYILLFNFGILTVIFIGYSWINALAILCVLYILDNICFGFNMAISTYLRKICPEEELSSSLAMGSTVNHIAAIFIPFVGGMLWDTYGYSIAFLMGAAITLFSVIVTYFIKDLSRPAGSVQRTA